MLYDYHNDRPDTGQLAGFLISAAIFTCLLLGTYMLHPDLETDRPRVSAGERDRPISYVVSDAIDSDSHDELPGDARAVRRSTFSPRNHRHLVSPGRENAVPTEPMAQYGMVERTRYQTITNQQYPDAETIRFLESNLWGEERRHPVIEP